jgi:nucleolar protein 4
MSLIFTSVIFPNSPAASTLPSAELEKRINSFNQRRALLRSNPSLYVSKTRLSIRQLPTFATERSLKRLALHAIREFDKEVKENARDPLAEDEIDDGGQKTVADSLMGEKIHLPQKRQEEPNTNSSASGSNNAKRKGAFSKVKQAKIVRTADRVDPMTGKGRSKGYGFLETEKHSDALKVLRWANNNLDVYALLKNLWSEEMKDLVGVLEKKAKKDEEEMSRLKRLKAALSGGEGEERGSKRTLVVEFSIENVVIMKKREGRDAPGSVCNSYSRDQ